MPLFSSHRADGTIEETVAHLRRGDDFALADTVDVGDPASVLITVRVQRGDGVDEGCHQGIDPVRHVNCDRDGLLGFLGRNHKHGGWRRQVQGRRFSGGRARRGRLFGRR